MAAEAPGQAQAPSMRELLARYGHSNCDLGTDKAVVHCYGELYDRLLGGELRRRARAVVEAGVASGASLVALAEFFPGAQVTGIDVDVSRVRFAHPRVAVREADCTTPAALELFGPGAAFDLVLDDASHRPNDQVALLRLFGPRLAPGGMVVVESVDGRFYEEARARLDAQAAALGLAAQWHDMRHATGRFDDVVAVFTDLRLATPAPVSAPPAPAPAPVAPAAPAPTPTATTPAPTPVAAAAPRPPSGLL